MERAAVGPVIALNLTGRDARPSRYTRNTRFTVLHVFVHTYITQISVEVPSTGTVEVPTHPPNAHDVSV